MKGSMECKRIRHEITPCSYGIVRRCIVAFAKFKESLPVDLHSVEEGLKSIKDLIEGNFRPKLDRLLAMPTIHGGFRTHKHGGSCQFPYIIAFEGAVSLYG